MSGSLRFDVADDRGVSRARSQVREALAGLDPDVIDAAELVTSELVTNAMLHGGGVVDVRVQRSVEQVRVAVTDNNRRQPVVGLQWTEGMTGRGLRLVSRLSSRWGVDPVDSGKVVWAEISASPPPPPDLDADDILAAWGEDWDDFPEAAPRYRVALGEVPTDLLVSAKTHVDNVIREFTLAAAGERAGMTTPVPPRLGELIDTVLTRFGDARLAIKRQATDAARAGLIRTTLELDLPANAAEAGEDYLAALDEVDSYCRATRMLTLETPPQHRVFRRWYVGEIVRQLRAADAGLPVPAPEPFEIRLLHELDSLAAAQHSAERAARLYALAVALATAVTPEEVATAVLHEGVSALGARGGGVLLAADARRLTVPGTLGYDAELVERLRQEPRDAELPAAAALRTAEPVWLESKEERDERFPELAGLEAATVAMCALPLISRGRALGAVRFSFDEPRLFDREERQFALALAAETAQALDRALLQHERTEIARRLQKGLLPPRIPDVPGLEVAAFYQATGEGMEVGGDFLDVWEIGDSRWAFALGDVTGSGPEAAALAALVRFTLRAVAVIEADPAVVMNHVNVALTNYLEAGGEDERFCTAIFGLVHRGAGTGVRLTLAGGGSPDGFLRRRDGDIELVEVRGSFLGVLPDPVIEVHDVVLAPGDTLVLLTDGVLEARTDGTIFGNEGVEAALRDVTSAEHATQAIAAAVQRYIAGGALDDMAVLALHAR